MTWALRSGAVGSSKLLGALILAIAIGFAGCATVTPPEAKLPAPSWEAGQLIDSMKQRNQQFRSARALVQVDYAGPDGKHGFKEVVIVQRPDCLRLETMSLLGAVLIVTVNRDELIGYYPRDAVFVRGARTKENLRRYTQIPLELEEITMLLVGLPPVDPGARVKQEGNALVFSSNSNRRDVVSFESQQPVPTKWERFNADGQVELSAQFGDYISTPAGPFPVRINFEANLQNKKVQIRYEQPEINPNVPSTLFSQTKPPNVQEVPIEAIGS